MSVDTFRKRASITGFVIPQGTTVDEQDRAAFNEFYGGFDYAGEAVAAGRRRWRRHMRRASIAAHRRV